MIVYDNTDVSEMERSKLFFLFTFFFSFFFLTWKCAGKNNTPTGRIFCQETDLSDGVLLDAIVSVPPARLPCFKMRLELFKYAGRKHGKLCVQRKANA